MNMAKEKNQEKKTRRRKDIVATRGRTFEGYVVRKFQKHATIEFNRTVYINKYERFTKKTTRLHARLPENTEVNVGDLVKVKECRPLSKMIHFIVVEKIKSAGGGDE
ncbi:30S ribosomal protein S17 [Candidatus Pacearchaeota archaeon]|nr:30S ribosomal protein S17 [Candidatus Pacearchaeota archaeon]